MFTLTRNLLALAGAVALLAVGPAGSASAQAPKTCPNKQDTRLGAEANQTHVVLQACRAPHKASRGQVHWRGYGSIKIGARATVANSCEITVTGYVNGRPKSAESQNCTPALRKGVFFTYFERGLVAAGQPQYTRVCYELFKGPRRQQGMCVNSKQVRGGRG